MAGMLENLKGMSVDILTTLNPPPEGVGARAELRHRNVGRGLLLENALAAERMRADTAETNLGLTRKALSAAMLGWSDTRFGDTLPRKVVQPLVDEVAADVRECMRLLQHHLAQDPDEHRVHYVAKLVEHNEEVERELRTRIKVLQDRLEDALVASEAAATDLEITETTCDAVKHRLRQGKEQHLRAKLLAQNKTALSLALQNWVGEVRRMLRHRHIISKIANRMRMLNVSKAWLSWSCSASESSRLATLLVKCSSMHLTRTQHHVMKTWSCTIMTFRRDRNKMRRALGMFMKRTVLSCLRVWHMNVSNIISERGMHLKLSRRRLYKAMRTWCNSRVKHSICSVVVQGGSMQKELRELTCLLITKATDLVRRCSLGTRSVCFNLWRSSVEALRAARVKHELNSSNWREQLLEAIRNKIKHRLLLSSLAQMRVLTDARHTQLAVFQEWHQHMAAQRAQYAEQDRRQELLRRVVLRICNRVLAAALQCWNENVRESKIMSAKSTKVLARWRFRCASACWLAWRECLESEARRQEIIRRMIARIEDGKLRGAFSSWCMALQMEQQEKTRRASLMYRIVLRMRHRILAGALRSWLDVVDSRKDQESATLAKAAGLDTPFLKVREMILAEDTASRDLEAASPLILPQVSGDAQGQCNELEPPLAQRREVTAFSGSALLEHGSAFTSQHKQEADDKVLDGLSPMPTDKTSNEIPQETEDVKILVEKLLMSDDEDTEQAPRGGPEDRSKKMIPLLTYRIEEGFGELSSALPPIHTASFWNDNWSKTLDAAVGAAISGVELAAATASAVTEDAANNTKAAALSVTNRTVEAVDTAQKTSKEALTFTTSFDVKSLFGIPSPAGVKIPRGYTIRTPRRSPRKVATPRAHEAQKIPLKSHNPINAEKVKSRDIRLKSPSANVCHQSASIKKKSISSVDALHPSLPPVATDGAFAAQCSDIHNKGQDRANAGAASILRSGDQEQPPGMNQVATRADREHSPEQRALKRQLQKLGKGKITASKGEQQQSSSLDQSPGTVSKAAATLSMSSGAGFKNPCSMAASVVESPSSSRSVASSLLESSASRSVIGAETPAPQRQSAEVEVLELREQLQCLLSSAKGVPQEYAEAWRHMPTTFANDDEEVAELRKRISEIVVARSLPQEEAAALRQQLAEMLRREEQGTESDEKQDILDAPCALVSDIAFSQRVGAFLPPDTSPGADQGSLIGWNAQDQVRLGEADGRRDTRCSVVDPLARSSIATQHKNLLALSSGSCAAGTLI